MFEAPHGGVVQRVGPVGRGRGGAVRPVVPHVTVVEHDGRVYRFEFDGFDLLTTVTDARSGETLGHVILNIPGRHNVLNALAVAALASELAAQIYGLDVVARQIEDQKNNTTRFLVMAPAPDLSRRSDHMITTFTFRVRNIPAALYKAMGGFATNGVNMTKLESYMVGGSFTATQFFAEIEGHPDDDNVRLALDELRYFTSVVRLLGVYPADPRRAETHTI